MSATSRCSTETDGQIDLIFWHRGFFQPVLHCVVRKFRDLQKLWHFFLNSGLRKFRHDISSKHAINLAQERLTLRTLLVSRVDNTSELRRSTAVVYLCDHQALSTARFRCVGQLATADTFFSKLLMLLVLVCSCFGWLKTVRFGLFLLFSYLIRI